MVVDALRTAEVLCTWCESDASAAARESRGGATPG